MGPLSARSDERPRRIDVRVPVEILCSRGIKLCGKTRNVSTGGMFVETGLLLPIGSPVRLDVALDHRAIELLGRVAWSRQKGPTPDHTPGMGIQIVGWEADARQVLDRVLDEVPANDDDDDDEPYAAVVVDAVEPYDSVQITAPMRLEAVPEAVQDVEVTEKTSFHDVRTPQRVAMGVVFMSMAAVAAAIVLTLLPGGSSEAAQAKLATQAPSPAAPTRPAATPPVAAQPAPAPAPEPEPTTLDEPAQVREELVVMPHADGTTLIVVPLDGEPTGLKHYPLANPTGIAVRMDGASTAVARGVFRQEQGGTHKIWLPANGHEVRLFTRGALPPYTVETRGRELRVILGP